MIRIERGIKTKTIIIRIKRIGIIKDKNKIEDKNWVKAAMMILKVVILPKIYTKVR
jgi:hypothetical protein